jgi:chromosome segregation ATPase
MSNYTERVSELTRRVADIDARLKRLTERRNHLAVSAAEGNKGSIKSIAELDDEADGLHKERQTLSAAIEQIADLQRKQEAEIARKDREKREAEARKIADSVMAMNEKIDDAMVQLAGLFQERANLIHQLGKMRVMSSTTILTMSQRHSPTAAARAAGLHKFIEIDHVSPGLIRPLAEGAGGLHKRITVRADHPKDAA